MTGASRADGPGSIVWLASYPKSGNTWVRALLTNYFHSGEGPASINALLGGRIANVRHLFDELLGVDSSELTSRETSGLRPLLHRLLADELPRPTFVKTHGAYVCTEAGEALFPREATAGAVYLVRNPLDVAVSFAHHENQRVGWAVARLNDTKTVLEGTTGRIHSAIPEPLLSWSAHACSWLDQDAIPVHVLRYEDLHADPVAGLAGVVRFAGFEPESSRLRAAVNRSAFARLRRQEARVGFAERQPTAGSFFRAGVVGDWRVGLSREQARGLVAAHRAAMARLGFLDRLPADIQAEAG